MRQANRILLRMNRTPSLRVRPVAAGSAFAVCFCLLLAACGPRDIGAGTASELSSEGPLSAAETMRRPMTGSDSTQYLLYHYNRPEVMDELRERQRLRIIRMHGGRGEISPEDPEYRTRPKQRSPFRQ